MVAHPTRFFADLTLGPGDERVETSVQIPEGFTPEMLEIDGWGAVRPDTPRSVDSAAVKAMHCSLVVAVRFDDAPIIFQAPFGHLPARLSAGEARNLTILIERHDRPGDRERPETLRRGATHPRAKFTDDQIREIRTAYAAGARLVDLARSTGIPEPTLYKIVRRQRWAHVQ